jgi:hypothetical protein
LGTLEAGTQRRQTGAECSRVDVDSRSLGPLRPASIEDWLASGSEIQMVDD